MIRILFVCHGNICRSVGAEMVLKKMLSDAGADLVVDSAATSSEEIGNDIYPPMKRELIRRGIPCEHHAARKLTSQDGKKYDLIIGMDFENIRMIRRILPVEFHHKVKLITDYLDYELQEIDDPWYTRDFATAVDRIIDACRMIMKEIRA